MLKRELKVVLDVVRIDDLGINDLDFGILKDRIILLSEKFFEETYLAEFLEDLRVLRDKYLYMIK